MVLVASLASVIGAVAANDLEAPGFDEMAVSGTAISQVSDRIDPALPLGTCEGPLEPDWLRVVLPNLRNSQGNVRISLYRGTRKEWMKKGAKLIRFDVPAQSGRMEVCMPLPFGPGAYGLALYHDEDADTDYDFASEGYGFSNNAKAQLFGPARFKRAVFTAHPGENRQDIRIRY